MRVGGISADDGAFAPERELLDMYIPQLACRAPFQCAAAGLAATPKIFGEEWRSQSSLEVANEGPSKVFRVTMKPSEAFEAREKPNKCRNTYSCVENVLEAHLRLTRWPARPHSPS